MWTVLQSPSRVQTSNHLCTGLQKPLVEVVRKGSQSLVPGVGEVVTGKVRTPVLLASPVQFYWLLVAEFGGSTCCCTSVPLFCSAGQSCWFPNKNISSAQSFCLMQVTRVNNRLAALDILCVGVKPVDDKFPGIIRYAWNLQLCAWIRANFPQNHYALRAKSQEFL